MPLNIYPPEAGAPVTVHGTAKVEIFQPDPATGKPYLRLEFPDGMVVRVTLNIMEMLGGAAAGARKRWEEVVHSHSN